MTAPPLLLHAWEAAATASDVESCLSNLAAQVAAEVASPSAGVRHTHGTGTSDSGTTDPSAVIELIQLTPKDRLIERFTSRPVDADSSAHGPVGHEAIAAELHPTAAASASAVNAPSSSATSTTTPPPPRPMPHIWTSLSVPRSQPQPQSTGPAGPSGAPPSERSTTTPPTGAADGPSPTLRSSAREILGLSTDACPALIAWIDRGAVAVFPADAPPPELACLTPFHASRERTVIALPLNPPAAGSHHRSLAIVILPLGVPCSDAVVTSISMIRPALAAALERHHEREELVHLRNAAEAERASLLRRLGRDSLGDEIIGAASGLRPVMERIELAARADVPVLILGETGAGKEVIARAVHDRSQRHERPFIRVNCGAIPPDLIDSELFGHERGAFTGATETRRGWFEQADGGTLFLDEIGELPLPAQVRLLRVLQDGTIQRVGGQRPIRVDVRIVAATHRDLPTLVQRREFREDLWYRVAVFPVLLPPLRDRPQDIPELAHHFARRAARRFGLHAAPLTPGDLARLAAYHWPGNVRELTSVIDRAVILGGGRTIEIATSLGAPMPTRNGAHIDQTTGLPSDRGNSGPADPIDTLDEAMRRHIALALQRARGQVEGDRGAAATLGINPHTLRSRMRRLGLRWTDFRS